MKIKPVNTNSISCKNNDTKSRSILNRDNYSLIAEGAVLLTMPFNYSKAFMKEQLPKINKIGNGILTAGLLGMAIDIMYKSYKLFSRDYESDNRNTKAGLNIKRAGLVGEIAVITGSLIENQRLFDYLDGTKHNKFRNTAFIISMFGIFADAIFKIVESEVEDKKQYPLD